MNFHTKTFMLNVITVIKDLQSESNSLFAFKSVFHRCMLKWACMLVACTLSSVCTRSFFFFFFFFCYFCLFLTSRFCWVFVWKQFIACACMCEYVCVYVLRAVRAFRIVWASGSRALGKGQRERESGGAGDRIRRTLCTCNDRSLY